jgi:hypothetical protein
LPKSFGLDLADLSRDSWSLVPGIGDFLAEVDTRRFGTLTYTLSDNDPEDITVFDRSKRRNLSVYASKARAAAQGNTFDEDASTEIRRAGPAGRYERSRRAPVDRRADTSSDDDSVVCVDGADTEAGGAARRALGGERGIRAAAGGPRPRAEQHRGQPAAARGAGFGR